MLDKIQDKVAQSVTGNLVAKINEKYKDIEAIKVTENYFEEAHSKQELDLLNSVFNHR
jgi:hypothetical protein